MLIKIKRLLGVCGGFMPDDRYTVVEIEKPRPLANIDPEVRKSVASLAIHPGFRFLLAKLDSQKQFLQGKLVNETHGSIKDVHQLQAAIHWCGWLQTQLKFETALSEAKAGVAPTQEEINAFEMVNSQLQVVGA